MPRVDAARAHRGKRGVPWRAGTTVVVETQQIATPSVVTSQVAPSRAHGLEIESSWKTHCPQQTTRAVGDPAGVEVPGAHLGEGGVEGAVAAAVMSPQHATVPSMAIPHVWEKPALTWVKVAPSGGCFPMTIATPTDGVVVCGDAAGMAVTRADAPPASGRPRRTRVHPRCLHPAIAVWATERRRPRVGSVPAMVWSASAEWGMPACGLERSEPPHPMNATVVNYAITQLSPDAPRLSSGCCRSLRPTRRSRRRNRCSQRPIDSSTNVTHDHLYNQ